MSLPILLGSKAVSSRPLIAFTNSSNNSAQDEDEHDYYAEDGMTPLDPVQVPGPTLTATAACPQQEWSAFATIKYFDMMMVVDQQDSDDGSGEESSQDDEQAASRGLRRLARHSTVAQVQIQISSLSLPYSSAYKAVTHRLTLPSSPVTTQRSFLDEHYLQHMSAQPCLVFSSDRKKLACLIPYPRGPQSALVAFTLERPTQQFAPPKLPKLPSYIPTSSSSSSSPTQPKVLPQALQDPEWLQLPSNAALDILDGAHYWLSNITAICNTSTSTQQPQSFKQHKGSSVLLAGCRDGSILGISFYPLLLAGRLYHPSTTTEGGGAAAAISFLSHITTTQPPGPSTDMGSSQENIVLGKLVAIQESGTAVIFQTRMVLSSLTQDGNVYTDNHDSSHFELDESTSALYHDTTDATDYSATENAGGATGVMMIHGESFHVVKAGRRNSLPANTRFAENEPLLQHPNQASTVQNSHHHVVGNTGLLMLVEHVSEYPGSICRAQWITGSLLAVLEKPTKASSAKRKDGTRNRVAQVLGVPSGRPPEPLTELTLASEDLNENAHTRFALTDDSINEEEVVSDSIEATDKSYLAVAARDAASVLEASLGIQYDTYSGCLAISSARISSDFSPSRNKDGDKMQSHPYTIRVFVSLWHWRTNTSGFTAVSTTNSLDSCHHYRPTSRLLLTKERLTNVRRVAHLHSVCGKPGCDRLRKDLYEVGFMSPPQNVRSNIGLGVTEASPILLTSSSVAFPLVSQPASQNSEIEWHESDIPKHYRLDYGAPVVAAMSNGGRAIAVASSRGLCVLECSPRPKKFSVVNDRSYLFEDSAPSTCGKESQKYGVRYRLPPKWHLFGNETEERAFRVLALTWWEGHHQAKRNHVSDDLLVAVVQLQRQDTDSKDPAGTCYLACWSQRRLDASHQRLRPLDANLQSSRCQWGVRLPGNVRVKSLKLLAQPDASASVPHGRQRERKAVVMLSSMADQLGLTTYIVYQLQVISSVGRTQSSESYVEHNPYSVLSRQCSSGEIKTGEDSSGSSMILAGASFQFDLRQKRKLGSETMLASNTGEKVNEIIGTIGVIKSPGSGLDAVVLTSMGASRRTVVIDSQENGNAKPLKSSEVSSYWLSDFLHAQRPILTTYSENALMDFYVWTFQLADGNLLTWFVPCLEFEPRNGNLSPNVFSSRAMLGIVCPNGTSSTWLQRSPAKTGVDFMVGCVPHSPHGCVLNTGQASRKFHRTIAGGFDHSLFGADFMEHEFLYPRDLELSPPAFMSSLAALIKSSSFLLVASSKGKSSNNLPVVNAGGEDVEKALLAVDTATHVLARSKPHQDAAFMASRLLVLRSVEQLSDDMKKRQSTSDSQSILSSSVLAEVLHIVRSCTASRLQFTSLILEVGRQLEPSCFPQLFPLPTTAPSAMAKGIICAPGLTTVAAFFDACMEDGSLLSSVSSLPIISARSLSLQNSILLLEHCLQVFKENTKSENDFFFDFSREERSALGDIFRFGTKLEDTTNDDDEVVDFHVDRDLDDASIDSSTDSSHSDEDDNDYTSKKEGYSLACGMLNLSWFSRKTPLTKQNVNRVAGKAGSMRNTHQENNDNLLTGNVAGSVASVLVQMTVSGENEPHSRVSCWKRAAALAALIVGQGESTLPRLSARECMSLFKHAGSLQGKGHQATLMEDGITTLLTRCMVACSTDIASGAAGKILDLILILLSRAQNSSDFDSFLPGLLVIGITAGHASKKINEILDIEDRSVSFTRCYWTAKEKADSLYSC